jgi:hypothetical protein
MRKLISVAVLAATVALTDNASAGPVTYALSNVGMSSSATSSGVAAGTLTGEFTINGTTLDSADITASSATVSGHTFPGFEYTYGISGANSTLTDDLGQAEPNFTLDSGSNELRLAWTTGDASPTLISAFDPGDSYEHEPAGGTRVVTSGDAPDIPVAPVPTLGPLATLALLALGIFSLHATRAGHS